MLRVQGCRAWQRRKGEEVREAKAVSSKYRNIAAYDIFKTESLTLETLQNQAAASLQLKADLDVAKKKISDLEVELEEARTDGALLDSVHEAVSRLEKEAEILKTANTKLQAANSELKGKVEGFDAEKMAMLAANDEETLVKMKMAWETYFTSSFSFF